MVNGIKLINLAINKNMVLSCTRFPRKNIFKKRIRIQMLLKILYIIDDNVDM